MSGIINLQDIKNLLVRIRTAKHLSQADVTTSICTQGMVSKIEVGKTSPSFLIVSGLLSQMNISLSEFEYLYSQEHEKQNKQLQETVENIIDTYQFFLFNTNKNQQLLTLYIHKEVFINWTNFCFNIQLESENIIANSQTHIMTLENILNQDEFFNNDFYQIIYNLIFLKPNAALYNYHRLQSQIKKHQIKKIKPFVVIDAAITMGAIFYNAKDYTNAYHFFYIALQKANHLENIPRIIIAQIILTFLSNDKTFLQKAQQLSQLFSKDIFFNYWYNVLYTKFNEV